MIMFEKITRASKFIVLSPILWGMCGGGVGDKNGKEIMVDKTWLFKNDSEGKLRIIAHKFSLPFSPAN